jgi:hypothetical protein
MEAAVVEVAVVAVVAVRLNSANCEFIYLL